MQCLYSFTPRPNLISYFYTCYIFIFTVYRRSGNFCVKNISCVKISWRKIFVRPIVYEFFFTGVKLRWRLSNESCVSAATTCTSAFGRLLWERFFTANESRQTVETDTLWLSKNIRVLNFRKPGHLRKYCNNENFPIYGISINTCSYFK